MPVYNDMGGFPESGFPVLANELDAICLNTLNIAPLKANGFILDLIGNCRLLGALTLGGAVTGITTLAIGGALSGVTTLGASGLVTLSGASPISMTHADAVLLMTGMNASLGTTLQRIRRGFFTDLEIKNKPTVDGDPVVVQGDLARYTPTSDLPSKATTAEVKAGTDDTKYTTPAGIRGAEIFGWLENQVFN